jgi:hypothetical protein
MHVAILLILACAFGCALGYKAGFEDGRHSEFTLNNNFASKMRREEIHRLYLQVGRGSERL